MGLGTEGSGLNRFHVLQQWCWISSALCSVPAAVRHSYCSVWSPFPVPRNLQRFEGCVATHQRCILLARKHGCALHVQKCFRWAREGCRPRKALEDCRDGRVLSLTVRKLCQFVLVCLSSWHAPRQCLESANSPVHMAFRSSGLFGPLLLSGRCAVAGKSCSLSLPLQHFVLKLGKFLKLTEV